MLFNMNTSKQWLVVDQLNNDETTIPVEAIPNIVLPKPSIKNDSNPVTVKVLHVESPHSFFLQLREEEDCFKKFSQHITEFYSEVKEEPFKVDHLPVASTWAVFSGKKWYRACVIKKIDLIYSRRVKQQPHSIPQFLMLFVDLGVTKILSLDNIRYLHEQFQVKAPFALHCQLAEIYPTSCCRWLARPWKEETLKAFSDFCFGSDHVLALFVHTNGQEPPYSVVLESVDGKIVNEELVIRGLAESSVITRFQEKTRDGRNEADLASTPSAAVEGEEEEELLESSWNPLAEAFFGAAHTSYLDNECAETLFTGLRNRDDDTICRPYRKNLSCPRGETCGWRHALPRADGLSGDSVGTFSFLEGDTVYPKKGDFVQAIVTTVYSPSEFYILTLHPASRSHGEGSVCEVTFFELQKELQSCYRNSRRYMETPLPATGELVVVCSDSSGPLMGYHRARVLTSDGDAEATKVKVFYIDLGYTGWVKENQLRPFSVQFLRPPPLAVRCYLTDIAPVSGAWHEQDQTFLASWIKDKIVTVYAAEEDYLMDGRLGVVLLDLSGKDDVVVNEAFVDAGLAMCA